MAVYPGYDEDRSEKACAIGHNAHLSKDEHPLSEKGFMVLPRAEKALESFNTVWTMASDRRPTCWPCLPGH